MSKAFENLRDSRWDYWAIVWTALLVPFPILAFYVCRNYGLPVAASEDVVTLLVMVPLGGPHILATFLRTSLDRNFRRGERAQYYLSWCVYAVVVATALASVFLGLRAFGIVPMQLLLTVFFFWASFHILQQTSYCAASFESREADARWGKWLELAVIFGSLYPISFFRMSMIDPLADGAHANPHAFATQLVVAATGSQQFADEYIFRIGRTIPTIPAFMRLDIIWIGALLLYVGVAAAYAVRVARQWRDGMLEWRRFQLVGLSATIGFFVPIVPNLDSAFQGMNAWHCAQYLRLSWMLQKERRERGEIGNRLSSWFAASPSMGRYYWTLLGITVAGVLVMFAIAGGIQAASGGRFLMFGVDPSELARDPATGYLEYRPGSLLLTYYLLGFGMLLMHYFQDSWFFQAKGSLGKKIAEEQVGHAIAGARLNWH